MSFRHRTNPRELAEGDVTAAALTVEPESGSTQPTTPIRLVGPLKRST